MKKSSMMSRFFKITAIVLGALLALFGIVGGILELSSEQADTTGRILAPVFIVLGGVFLYLGWRKKRNAAPDVSVREAPPESAGKVTEKKPAISPEEIIADRGHSFWQRKFLIIAGSAELIFLIITIIVASVFGIAGLTEAETGTMVGLLMFGAATGLGAIIAARAVALWGIIKRKPWAPVLNLVVMAILAILSLFSFMWPLMVYFAFEGWCSYFLITHPPAA